MSNTWHEEKEVHRNTPTAVFLMGSGGSGKGYWLRHSAYAHLPVVNPDDYLADPTHPTEGREMAKVEALARMAALVKAGRSFVRDTTGTNIARMMGEFALVRESGYMIVLIFVQAELATCLARNQARMRTIPEEVLIADHTAASIAYETISGSVDVAYTVENNGGSK